MAKRFPAFVILASLIALPACGGRSSSAGAAASCTGSVSASSPGDAISTWRPTRSAILVNGKGYALYATTADTAKRRACANCSTSWSPLVINGAARLGPGLNRSLVGRVDRADGSHQLTYGGHPLYTYRADTGPHLANGQGLKSCGGTWYVVSARNGQLITKKLTTTQKNGNGPGY